MKADKVKKLSVLLDNDEFLRFEEYCELKGFKKSTLVARLIREHLDRENFTSQYSLALDHTTEINR